ncbi:MAG: aminotransferase class I/II-fold pyridoxal phosphate-dependent enzyme, partial [Dehalococcoidales bacterium]|nr:aminotransferase class I/II-fold pyridoxal phosphate-dependent enzyme [Dehalococcoidales bacterium]
KHVVDHQGLEYLYPPKAEMTPASSRIKGMILCNPHNPIGRVWSKGELTRMGETIIKEGGIVIADEIHCEILYKGENHTPFASISEEFAQNSVICMAPSKTFNLAGLEASSIIIPNKKLRRDFTATMGGILPRPNVFGYVALEAAYRHGDEWLDQVLEYLQANLDFTTKYFADNIPEIKVVKPQGTYLVWLDCRALKLDNQAMRTFFRERAKVGFDDGFVFGAGGEGFQRMNIACPRPMLSEALGRIEQAVKSLR